jgi:hypothetical protein
MQLYLAIIGSQGHETIFSAVNPDDLLAELWDTYAVKFWENYFTIPLPSSPSWYDWGRFCAAGRFLCHRLTLQLPREVSHILDGALMDYLYDIEQFVDDGEDRLRDLRAVMLRRKSLLGAGFEKAVVAGEKQIYHDRDLPYIGDPVTATEEFSVLDDAHEMYQINIGATGVIIGLFHGDESPFQVAWDVVDNRVRVVNECSAGEIKYVPTEPSV